MNSQHRFPIHPARSDDAPNRPWSALTSLHHTHLHCTTPLPLHSRALDTHAQQPCLASSINAVTAYDTHPGLNCLPTTPIPAASLHGFKS